MHAEIILLTMSCRILNVSVSGFVCFVVDNNFELHVNRNWAPLSGQWILSVVHQGYDMVEVFMP